MYSLKNRFDSGSLEPRPFIIPCFSIAESGNIGMGPVRLGICLSCHPSIHPGTFLHDGWMDFLHICYHDQVPWAAADAHEIDFGSV